jgi:hypothetical protein
MDKMLIVCSPMFPLHFQGDKFVTWNGVTWVLDENRWGTFCAEMADRGVNMMRWLGWNVWYHLGGITPQRNLTPFMVDSSGKYILSFPNEKYWEIAERMIDIMNYPSQTKGNTAPGITLWMDLAYQYTYDADDIKGSPWRNNTIGTTDLYGQRNWQYFEACMLRWFALAKKIHLMTGKPLKIVFSLGNELGAESLAFGDNMLRVMDRERVWPFSWGICPELPLIGDALFKKSLDVIRNENLFAWHPLRAIGGDAWEASIKRPVHHVGRDYHGLDVLQNVLDNWGGNPIGKVLSDDGCLGADGKPNAAEWCDLMRRICTWRGTDAITIPWSGIDHPYIGVEHLPDDELWDVCREKQLLVFEAIARCYNQYIGKLENQGQWPDKWKEQQPDPIPNNPPARKKCTFWSHFDNTWNFRAAWAHLMGRHK